MNNYGIYAHVALDVLYDLYTTADDEALILVESEIERRECLNMDTDHWLAGSINHPQALIS